MKKSFLLLLSINICMLAMAQTEFAAKNFEGRNGVELNFQELLPVNYSEGGKFPLVLFLHGAGERGNDNLKQLAHGSKMFTNPVNQNKYPAVVLFPQCPAEMYWAFDKRPENGFSPDVFPAEYEITPVLSTVRELVGHYVENERIDTDRIYIIGLSMGGMATFDMVCRFPDLFAAAIPICGGVHPARLKSAANVKLRIFHGDEDNVVPYENSRLAYMALKEAGAYVEYYELPGVNHGSWNPAFNFPDFMEWLFAQSKSK